MEKQHCGARVVVEEENFSLAPSSRCPGQQDLWERRFSAGNMLLHGPPSHFGTGRMLQPCRCASAAPTKAGLGCSAFSDIHGLRGKAPSGHGGRDVRVSPDTAPHPGHATDPSLGFPKGEGCPDEEGPPWHLWALIRLHLPTLLPAISTPCFLQLSKPQTEVLNKGCFTYPTVKIPPSAMKQPHNYF